jgi:hypothetical protein
MHDFGVHSTRSASTSAALEAGLSVRDIMNVADWSNASTFNKFYKRSIDMMASLERWFCRQIPNG